MPSRELVGVAGPVAIGRIRKPDDGSPHPRQLEIEGRDRKRFAQDGQGKREHVSCADLSRIRWSPKCRRYNLYVFYLVVWKRADPLSLRPSEHQAATFAARELLASSNGVPRRSTSLQSPTAWPIHGPSKDRQPADSALKFAYIMYIRYIIGAIRFCCLDNFGRKPYRFFALYASQCEHPATRVSIDGTAKS